MSDVFLYILMMFAFIIIIVKFRLEIKNYYSTENKAVIKINSYSYLGEILVSLMFIHLVLKDWSNLDITKIISDISFIIMIIIFIINIPIEYKNESKLYFYEQGISLPVGKLIGDLKLISYDNI